MINIHHLSFVTVFVRLFTKRMDGNCFIYNVTFAGVNFPLNGPVMQKRTQGWEPNTERLYARDGMLILTLWLSGWKVVVIIRVNSEVLTSKLSKSLFFLYYRGSPS